MAILCMGGGSAGRDLWALGNCLYQFLTGYAPFKAPSAYLIFLRARVSTTS